MTENLNHWQLREQIIKQCLWMNASGLNQGTSGNISVRYKDSMLITPSGVPYSQLQPQDIAQMSLEHNRYEWEGPYAPSSEWHFHRAILQSNPSYAAVVHTHSTYATVLSMARLNIPACHYMIAAFGGNSVQCAQYATFGTDELSVNILDAMQQRSACLLANHGMVVAGKNLDKAMWAAVELETLSKQYYFSRNLDSLEILSDEEIETVVGKFANYGLQGKDAGQGSDADEQAQQSSAPSHPSDSYNSPPVKQPNVKLPVVK